MGGSGHEQASNTSKTLWAGASIKNLLLFCEATGLVCVQGWLDGLSHSAWGSSTPPTTWLLVTQSRHETLRICCRSCVHHVFFFWASLMPGVRSSLFKTCPIQLASNICQAKCFPFSYLSYQSTFPYYSFFSYYSLSISATCASCLFACSYFITLFLLFRLLVVSFEVFIYIYFSVM